MQRSMQMSRESVIRSGVSGIVMTFTKSVLTSLHFGRRYRNATRSAVNSGLIMNELSPEEIGNERGERNKAR